MYFDLLRQLHEETGRALTVVVDCISGTSAGGINGICLARALASYQTQLPLRDLWLKRGDLRQLLNALPWPWLPLRAISAVRRALTKQQALLHGDRMIGWLYEAFEAMNRTRGDQKRLGDDASSLVPHAETLDLLVTTTDLAGYPRLVATGTGDPMQRDTTYRHVLRFEFDPDSQQLSPLVASEPLAFTARVTSSIPGAFQAVSLDSFGQDLRKQTGSTRFDVGCFPRSLFAEYDNAGIDPRSRLFVDGGFLDNAPFGNLIDAIAAKPAQTEVDRRIVYMEPDPAHPSLIEAPATSPAPTAPGPVGAVWQMTRGPRGHQALLADLLRLRDLNQRISSVGEIADALMNDVQSQLNTLAAGWHDELDYDALSAAVTPAVRAAAFHQAGRTYATYQQLKVAAAARAVADRLVAHFGYARDASQASFIRGVLNCWVRQLPVWQPGTQPPAPHPSDVEPVGDLLDDTQAFLAAVDLPYRRRLQFLLQGINQLYGDPQAPRERLGELKERAHTALAQLTRGVAAAWSQLSDRTAIFGKDALTEDVWLEDPAVFARRHNDQLADLLRGFAEVVAQYRDDRGRKVWEDFTELTSGWPAEAQQGRRNLLARYVGFPLWDTAIFPVVALTDLPQLSPIGVARFSPYDARLLPAPGGRKLWGTAYQHFGAFFEFNWRQNDYLWGRLDGVELIVRMLVEAGAGPLEHSEVDQWIRAQAPQGFEAVLKSEPRLDAIEKLRADLTAAVRQLTQIHR